MRRVNQAGHTVAPHEARANRGGSVTQVPVSIPSPAPLARLRGPPTVGRPRLNVKLSVLLKTRSFKYWRPGEIRPQLLICGSAKPVRSTSCARVQTAVCGLFELKRGALRLVS